MVSTIRFRCPSCKARIKAPAQLRGQTRPCPGCGNHFTIRTPAPEDSGPMLLLEDKPQRLKAYPMN
jgi:hypothetical protein